MRKLFFFIMLLSFIDAAATAVGIKCGYIHEGNPVIGSLVMKAPIFASIAAFIISAMLLSLIYSFRNRICWINNGLLLILVVKSSVVLLHLVFIVPVL